MCLFYTGCEFYEFFLEFLQWNIETSLFVLNGLATECRCHWSVEYFIFLNCFFSKLYETHLRQYKFFAL